VDYPERVEGKRVLIVGDGPTLTHGGMSFGAGTIAAQRFGAREVVDGRKYAVGSIEAAYQEYPHLGKEVPAVGYNPQQISDLEATINRADVDSVIDATPVDLSRLIKMSSPLVSVEYETEEEGASLQRRLTAFENRYLPAAK
jgi:predicted GTPase